jgi:hypothetical protein
LECACPKTLGLLAAPWRFDQHFEFVLDVFFTKKLLGLGISKHDYNIGPQIFFIKVKELLLKLLGSRISTKSRDPK